MRERCIAVGQTKPVPGDVDANTAEHLQLIELAAAERAQLIAFPELSLTGYEIGLARSVAFGTDDDRLAPLRDAATAGGLTVVAGAPVMGDAGLHIGAFVLLPDGSMELYTKQRMGAFGESARVDGTLPPPEASVFTAGWEDPLVRIGDDTAAIAVCADIGQPGHMERAVTRGATIYVASMFVIPSELAGDVSKLQSFAMGHERIVAFSNYGAASGGLAAAGRSTVWSQRGVAVVQLPGAGSGVGIARETDDGWTGWSVMT